MSGSLSLRRPKDKEPQRRQVYQGSRGAGPCLELPINVPLLRALWSLLDGIWGVLKGSRGVLVVSPEPSS